MSLKKAFVFCLFLLAGASVFGQSEQRYYKGALFDEEAYSSPLLTPLYNAKEAAFTATTDNSCAVTALVVAIEHR